MPEVAFPQGVAPDGLSLRSPSRGWFARGLRRRVHSRKGSRTTVCPVCVPKGSCRMVCSLNGSRATRPPPRVHSRWGQSPRSRPAGSKGGPIRDHQGKQAYHGNHFSAKGKQFGALVIVLLDDGVGAMEPAHQTNERGVGPPKAPTTKTANIALAVDTDEPTASTAAFT